MSSSVLSPEISSASPSDACADLLGVSLPLQVVLSGEQQGSPQAAQGQGVSTNRHTQGSFLKLCSRHRL